MSARGVRQRMHLVAIAGPNLIDKIAKRKNISCNCLEIEQIISRRRPNVANVRSDDSKTTIVSQMYIELYKLNPLEILLVLPFSFGII